MNEFNTVSTAFPNLLDEWCSYKTLNVDDIVQCPRAFPHLT